MQSCESLYRRRIDIRGVVQGVGFRPHVARTAAATYVTGLCGNDERGVFIEAQAKTEQNVEAFVNKLVMELPPLAKIITLISQEISPLTGEKEFRIIGSRHSDGERALIPPDTAICADCLAEFHDPTNPRYHYPFITCTHCGPRLSIITSLPYDRPRTTMAEFKLCPSCEREYTDPVDRRYHAQPISCYDCGPAMWIEPGAAIPGDPLVTASASEPTHTQAGIAELFATCRRLLDAGKILAVKGIGGFHLVCDATNEVAVQTLRKRKRRPDKPFAVMVPDMRSAMDIADMSAEERDLLASPEHPIVIAPKRSQCGAEGGVGKQLAGNIAPSLGKVGLMLPYSALHILLVGLGENARPLVVTSGNLSGEPVCFTNDDARQKLAQITDAFVMHNRGIVVPVEDSVFVGTSPSRRARGFAPLPVSLPTSIPSERPMHGQSKQPTILATGGELKNTFALAQSDVAHISSHIGDMGSLASQQAYRRAIDQLTTMRDATPDAVVCDLHPNYATTAFAERLADEHNLPLYQVQHHWAHALSLLAEHQIEHQPVVVATLDGTGYGLDGTIWGGEILHVSVESPQWSRLWHVPEFGIAGGDRAVRNPWRLALGIAAAWDIPEIAEQVRDRFRRSAQHYGNGDFSKTLEDGPLAEFNLVESQLNSGLGVVQTSSLGRVFDAAAALLLPQQPTSPHIELTYEAQAAMELEHLATLSSIAANSKSFPHIEADNLPKLFRTLFSDTTVREHSPAIRAAMFHDSVASIIANELIKSASAADTNLVGVTGGCSLNHVLMDGIRRRTEAAELKLLEHQTIPASDGGLCLGQAMAGRILYRS